MRIATRSVVLSIVAALLLPLGVARAQDPSPVRGPDESLTVENLLVSKGQGKSATNALTTIYDNTSATPQYGVSSTDLTSQWGDELLMTGTGLLSTHKFTLFNASSAGQNLLTATVSIGFFDAVTAASLGGYSGTINFGAGLPPGTFSIITASGLDPLLIGLTTSDIIVIQRVTAKTGTATKLGIVVMGPVLIGSSPTDMFIASASFGGGVPGFFSFPTLGPADPGHFIAVNPPPVGTTSKTWGALKKLYR